jgi:hypothetical protein
MGSQLIFPPKMGDHAHYTFWILRILLLKKKHLHDIGHQKWSNMRYAPPQQQYAAPQQPTPAGAAVGA